MTPSCLGCLTTFETLRETSADGWLELAINLPSFLVNCDPVLIEESLDGVACLGLSAPSAIDHCRDTLYNLLALLT